ncbi:MAG TPA: class I SAM-dependent methyltransferase [Puia sp.]|jgi:SAM-dependent methyltransferase
MEQNKNYFETNRKIWNEKTEIHIRSAFYDNKSFLEGKSSLKSIELNLLGNLEGRSVLHLQCHFGQDSISMSRLGAKVTGIDLSDQAIRRAREFATQTGTQTKFICCNIYDLPDHLDEQFDIVFTSYGTITWLPDLEKWAGIVSQYLKPNGRFILVEFHPVVWMFDDEFDKVGYSYFNAGPIIEKEKGDYAEPEALAGQEFVGWNHGMSEILNSLINNGLEINSFNEFDYSPYNCFRNTVEAEPGKYRIGHLGNKIPMLYSIGATKKRRC